jgi:hypothetical protein
MPRVFTHIFELIKSEKLKNNRVSLKVSCVEIYMENISDLISEEMSTPSETIRIAETDLRRVKVSCFEELVEVLKRCSLKRAVGSTSMNAQSSRSHAISTLYLEIKNTETNQVTQSKINLVDLAGSESQKTAETSGTRLNEGKNINFGLSILGKVINQLANKEIEKSKNKEFINYRDSNLTFLLKDSLGGNSNTLIIACISSDVSDKNVSLNTIRYVQVARKIENKVSMNVETMDESSSSETVKINVYLKFKVCFI